MIKLNFTFPIKDLNGEAIKEGNDQEVLACTLISDLLITARENTVKFMGWAIDLNSKREITVDEADYKLLKGFIVKNERMTNLSKYPILKYFDKKDEMIKSQADSGKKQ